jgi:hypothetical protein
VHRFISRDNDRIMQAAIAGGVKPSQSSLTLQRARA